MEKDGKKLEFRDREEMRRWLLDNNLSTELLEVLSRNVLHVKEVETGLNDILAIIHDLNDKCDAIVENKRKRREELYMRIIEMLTTQITPLINTETKDQISLERIRSIVNECCVLFGVNPPKPHKQGDEFLGGGSILEQLPSNAINFNLVDGKEIAVAYSQEKLRIYHYANGLGWICTDY